MTPRSESGRAERLRGVISFRMAHNSESFLKSQNLTADMKWFGESTIVRCYCNNAVLYITVLSEHKDLL